MNLHEYQAKQLFQEYGMPVPRGGIAFTGDEALSVKEHLGGDRCVVKAQVHAGGRGKAGGVKIVSTKEDLLKAVQTLIGTRLVTIKPMNMDSLFTQF